MVNYLELLQASFLLWLYLQTAWIFFVDLLYFTIPWLIYGAIMIFFVMRFGVRIAPPDDSAVKKVLGVDPLDIEEKHDFIISKDEPDESNKQYCMKVVAHRGGGYDYPENSMSAFRNSHNKGCDAIEFDLSLTKDNIPILFHDLTLDRLTGLNGTIKDMTWDELKDYDISTTHPLRATFNNEGEKIALFEDVLVETLKNNQRMFIDIKATGNEVVKIVLDAYKRHPELYEKAVITSFNPIVIYMIRRKNPRIVAGMAWRPEFFTMISYKGTKGPRNPRYRNIFKHIVAMIVDSLHSWALGQVMYYVLGLSFILLQKDLISPDVVRQWNERNVRVIAWTVNLPTEKIHFSKNLKITYLTDTFLS